MADLFENKNKHESYGEVELLTAAKIIKQYCSTQGLYKEEQCPFFMGYRKEGQCMIANCKLNLGHVSPCNWEI